MIRKRFEIAVLIVVVVLSSAFSADSLNVRLLGRYTATSPADMIVVGDTAYIANSSGGLQLLDVSDPGHISELGHMFLPGDATGICKIGDLVGIACSDGAFRILSTDPIDSIASFDIGSDVHRCLSIGDTVYLNGDEFSILDVSIPSAPWAIGDFSSVFDYSRFAVSPPYAYLAEKNYGLSVVDISNPSSPVGAGHYLALEEYVRGVAVDRGRVYLAANSGVFVFEWSGDSLMQIGFWASPDDAYDIEVDGIFAFVTCGSAGLIILNVADPSDIVEVGYYTLGSECTDLFLDYPIAWVIGLWARVNAMDIAPFAGIEEKTRPDALGLFAYPNPFNSSITILPAAGGVGASNARSGQVGVQIFDIAGRLVADLPATTCGIPQVVPTPRIWRPDKSVVSGIYLVRARVGDCESTERIIYLK